MKEFIRDWFNISIKIPEKIAKNQFLIFALAILAFIIFSPNDKVYGFITFIFFVLCFFINTFFVKVIYKEEPKKHNRLFEYIVLFLLVLIWLWLLTSAFFGIECIV